MLELKKQIQLNWLLEHIELGFQNFKIEFTEFKIKFQNFKIEFTELGIQNFPGKFGLYEFQLLKVG